VVATVKALAGALPARRDAPLSRSSTADLARLIAAHPDAPALSRRTIWRLRAQAALKPWRYQGWLFPRDPQFVAKAGRVLDLDAGWWEGQPLDPAACLLSADEQTSIQARGRRHATTPPRPGQPMRIEHAYARSGALADLAAWDVRRGGVIGRCEATTGLAPFGRLVDQVMAEEPYRASWLNQVELSFSVVQRKVLTPNDFPDLAAVEARLLAFQARYNDTAVPFHWRFTRQDLDDRLAALPEFPPPRPDSAPPPTAADHAVAV
jgi:hypothetical protein